MMKNKEVRQSIAMAIILFIGLVLISGCSTGGGGNAFHYQAPEYVTCYKDEVKVCEQYGSKMICECNDQKAVRSFLRNLNNF
jgi:hypothetical protein